MTRSSADECQPQFRIGRADSQFVYPASGPALACAVNGRASSAVRCKNLVGGYECECASRFGLQLAQGGLCCEDGNVPCLDGSQCVPFNALCNGVPDCSGDCSDERYSWCMFNSYNPPPNYATYPQCRRTDGAGGPAIMDGTIGQTASVTVAPTPQAPLPPPQAAGGDVAVGGGIMTPVVQQQRQAKSLLPADDNFVPRLPSRSRTSVDGNTVPANKLSPTAPENPSGTSLETPSSPLPPPAEVPLSNSSGSNVTSSSPVGTPAFSATALGSNDNCSQLVNTTVF